MRTYEILKKHQNIASNGKLFFLVEKVTDMQTGWDKFETMETHDGLTSQSFCLDDISGHAIKYGTLRTAKKHLEYMTDRNAGNLSFREDYSQWHYKNY